MKTLKRWTWKTENVDWPFTTTREELEFILLLIQHAVSILLLYITIVNCVCPLSPKQIRKPQIPKVSVGPASWYVR